MPVLTRTQIAVAVVLHDGKVLVGRRGATAVNAPGCCEFPGGKVEPGETPADAAVRECIEETGVTIRIGRRLDAVQADSASGPIDVLFFAAEVVACSPPKPPFAWERPANLAALAFPAANAGVIAWLTRHHGGS